jgi:lipoprotein-releasing system ATP-binding protein
MSLIQLRGVHKAYGKNRVLRGLDLDVTAGELIALRGASGSGKSTLLYLIGGLERPDAGDVTVGGENLGRMDDEELALYRNLGVGFVFQFHFLLPSLTALGNILLPARIAGTDLKEAEARARSLARRLGVEAQLAQWPHELSGGEQQRVNLIRALVLKPRLLLCDEPTGNLDSKNSALVVQLLKELAQENGATLLVVTHDEKVAEAFPRKILIEDGQIIR